MTARHEMEHVIRDEQMKLADFLDNAPVGFYSVDSDGRFLFVKADGIAHHEGEPFARLKPLERSQKRHRSALDHVVPPDIGRVGPRAWRERVARFNGRR